jgi:hypothetical protein
MVNHANVGGPTIGGFRYSTVQKVSDPDKHQIANLEILVAARPR